MPSNVTLNVGTLGSIAASKQITHDGDTTQLQGVFLMGVTGTEDAYTAVVLSGAVDTAAGATQAGIAPLAIRDDALATLTEVDGDLTLVRTNARGAVWVALDSTAAQTVSVAAGTNNIGDVDVLTVPADPFGANADAASATGSLSAKLRFIAATGIPVTSLPTLAAVTTVSTVTNVATIGTSIVPGTGATHLGKAEDTAHTTGDTGVMMLGVRRDANTSLVDTTGDYGPFQLSALGNLKVAIIEGAGSGGTAMVDAAAFTRTSTSITPIGGMVETSAPTVTNGNATVASFTTTGALRVNVASGGITGATEDAVASGSAEGILNIAVRDDALATLTPVDGDYTAHRTNARGALWVALDSTAAQTVTLAASTGTQEVVGDVAHDGVAAGNPVLIGARASAAAPSNVSADNDVTQLWALQSGALAIQPTYAGVLSVAGNGVSGTGVQRVTIANDSTGILATVTNVATIGTSVTPGTAAANLGKAEDAVHASGDTGVMALGVRTDTLAALATTTGDYIPFITDSVGAVWVHSSSELLDDAAFTPGTSRVQPIGLQADETATDSVDEGDIGAPRMTLDRKQIVTLYAHTAGGYTAVSVVSAASTNATSLKASAGTVGAVTVTSVNAAMRYLKFYNKATAPTVGTDTPVYVLPIPGNTAGAGATMNFPCGLDFSTGIAWALTVEATVAGTTGVSASEHVVSIAYK